MKKQLENMSTEILDTLCEAYKDDKELVVSCLMFLYYSTTDEKLQSNIVQILSDMNYCIECGSKMINYSWEETHDELDGCPKEEFSVSLCPNCDYLEIKNLNKKGGSSEYGI